MAEDALEYFRAARKIATGESLPWLMTFYRMPLNFLLGQCCELSLKSLLLTKGWNRKRWQKIRHDLVGLITAAKSEGISLDPEFVRYCEIMEEAHKEFDFRYSGRACPPAVLPEDALKMIEAQLRAIAELSGTPAAKW